MNRFFALLLGVVLCAGAGPAVSQERVTLGWGRLFTNDVFGDTRDRWRTGSYTLSRVRGASWDGTLPTVPGALLEFRIVGETIAPADLTVTNPADRRYVGSLSFGLHSHFDWQGFETSLGVDLVATGPQTGASNLQARIHDLLGLPAPTVLGSQIPDALYPTVSAELGRVLPFGAATVRPFLAAQAGVENLIRVGADLYFGGFTRGALMLRDGPSGQRYRAVAASRTEGFSFTVGGDVARVFDSHYFRPGDLAQARDTRSRVRAGIHWQGARSEMFYGLTWLGKEFTTQPDSQVVGSLNLRLKF